MSRFVVAFRLEWTRKEKAICKDMIGNVFKEDLTARHRIRHGCTIILLGQGMNAIMRRVRMPLMKLDASKDSDRINIYSVFMRKCYTREAPDIALDVDGLPRSADSMIQLGFMMVKPSIHSSGALKLNAVHNGHLVITLFKGDFVKTVVISKDSTFGQYSTFTAGVVGPTDICNSGTCCWSGTRPVRQPYPTLDPAAMKS